MNATDSTPERSPARWAREDPSRPAVVMAGSGATIHYGDLDRWSNGIARSFRACGATVGDHVAIVMENCLEYLPVAWAAQRSGLFHTPVNTHLTASEMQYVLDNAGARIVVASASMAARLGQVGGRSVTRLLVGDERIEGWGSLADLVAAQQVTAVDGETEGRPMLYSSGTTDRPKGVLRPLEGVRFGWGLSHEMSLYTDVLGFDADMVYLSPGPLYHTAPYMACLAVTRLGGTAVVMEHFDAADCLRAIERWGITHGQWVPTMFVRMLKLDAELRASVDVSSLRCALHAAAPCPVDVKRAMIEWWGPILLEFYSGTEGGGMTSITSEEWLEHPGSVGRPVAGCDVHVTDGDGEIVPVGTSGSIWFHGFEAAEFHRDPERTREVRNDRGWSTLGDVGYVDDDGYLYLTDRASHMIVSGGVNISPQEIENVLAMHDAVADVAVIGVPDADRGESVAAIVQLMPDHRPSDAVRDELLALCRRRLAGFKCPRTVEFRASLPRTPAGKLMKRVLKDEFWADHPTRVI